MLVSLTLGILLVLSAEARHRAYLDRAEKYLLEWENTDDNITFTVTANTTGWIGLGFSPSGGMTGADIVTGWITAQGKAVLQDRYATGKTLPKMDEYQNYKLHDAREVGGQTILTFSRRLETCDKDDEKITADTMRVIYAYGDNDPPEENPDYHGTNNRGTRSLALLGLVPKQVHTDVTTYDILPTYEIVIPSDHTSYICSLIKFPDLTKKYHMIQFEPIITPGNENVVHHMVMIGCYDGKDRSDHKGENATFSCVVAANMPQVYRECTQMISVWGVGGEETVFPPEAGFLFSNEEHPGYVVIQTHYDNPEKKAGMRDKSGFRITLTSKLRANDAATLQVGHSLGGMVIPPRQTAFQVDGFCPEPCAREVFPPEGITVFGAMLHSHLLGRKMYVRHFRKDIELPTGLSDSMYDFNYQRFRSIAPIKVLPGDTLMTTCFYDSSDRANVSFGGEATTQEMCLAYLMYYPKVSLSLCQSQPLWASGEGPLYQLLDVPARHWYGMQYQPIESVNWTENNRSAQFQQLYRTTEILMECMKDMATMNMNLSYQKWNPPSTRLREMPIGSSTCQLVQDKTTAKERNPSSSTSSMALSGSFVLTMLAVIVTHALKI